MRTLDQFQQNESGLIKRISPGPLTNKLTEMGLYPGKTVKLAFIAPLGDPIAIEIGDYTLTLRKQEAAMVEMESE